ncbi:hypothetical protein SBA5_10006 [Candidatus Sulfotelmatomonas gaucii]|uniref:Uncharacterized protein n=1 Tax=Candidatus Sulfuritelmatomonas gaucii TaxID=2043161 RepID=A0A2N9L246_9BACT|nr:hypothetical protein SBA5_10006 [Candidatus Sulfotelmatomonas gaucii]
MCRTDRGSHWQQRIAFARLRTTSDDVLAIPDRTLG